MSEANTVLEDFSGTDAHIAQRWSVFSDRVMGGVSVVQAGLSMVQGRRALRLTGEVSLERNGGFIQAALSLGQPLGQGADLRVFRALALTVCGTPGSYFIHLRTADTRAPWQYYGAGFPVSAEWRTVFLEWDEFSPESLRTPLDRRCVTRIGVVAGKAAFRADVAVSAVALVG